MFKVICIDVNPRPDSSDKSRASLKQLQYLGEYVVISIAPSGGYIIKGLVAAFEPDYGWRQDRFIPLSDIDEKELVQHRELAGVRESIENI